MYYKVDITDRAIDQIRRPDYWNQFERIYPFTTENISGYITGFDLKDKSLLTVGSSSDQVFNAYYCGCRDITLMDINPYIREYYHLKKSAIQTLSYEEFIKFFTFEGKWFYNFRALNYKMFKRVIAEMDDKHSKEFWDTIIHFTRPIMITSTLFSLDTGYIEDLKKMNLYLKDEESYNNLKHSIGNFKPNFICKNIYKYELKRNYDNIILSNIADYYEVDETHKLYRKLQNHLNKDGKMMITYLYQTQKDTKYDPKFCHIYDLDKTLKMFDDATIETITGVDNLNGGNDKMNDSLLVYYKK